MIERTAVIQNSLGLHARAAAKFVEVASQFRAHIFIMQGHQQVNGKSILGILSLAAAKGTELKLAFDGEDEDDAATAILNLIRNGFGEGK